MGVSAAAVESLVSKPRSAAGRSIYIFTAALFLVVAVVGFAPRSLRILSGTLPSPHLVVHVHAALMTMWLLLLLAQASLVSTGRRAVHQTLGLVSFVLAPAMLIAMVILVVTGYRESMGTQLEAFRANVVLPRSRPVILFPLLWILSMRVRRTDPETHKRLILAGTMVLFPAAIARIAWLPGYTPLVNNYIVLFYELLMLAPAVVYDVVKLGRPHRAYIIGLGAFAPFVGIALVFWDSPGWHRVVSTLIGY